MSSVKSSVCQHPAVLALFSIDSHPAPRNGSTGNTYDARQWLSLFVVLLLCHSPSFSRHLLPSLFPDVGHLAHDNASQLIHLRSLSVSATSSLRVFKAASLTVEGFVAVGKGFSSRRTHEYFIVHSFRKRSPHTASSSALLPSRGMYLTPLSSIVWMMSSGNF